VLIWFLPVAQQNLMYVVFVENDDTRARYSPVLFFAPKHPQRNRNSESFTADFAFSR